MPTFDPLHPLQSSVLEVLALHPGISVQELYGILIREHAFTVSLPTVYRTVAEMVEHQLLVREGRNLSLNLVWVSHLHQLVGSIQRTYTSAEETVSLPQKEGQRREYGAESLYALDPLWNHLLMEIARHTDEHTWWEYDSHPYYALGKPDTELRLYQSLTAEGVQCCVLHGNDTYLDHFGAKFIQMPGVNSSVVQETSFPKEGYILLVGGPYIVECVLPEILSKHFSFFFMTVRSPEQYDPLLFRDVFRMKVRCKITVRKSQQEARELERKIRAAVPSRG